MVREMRGQADVMVAGSDYFASNLLSWGILSVKVDADGKCRWRLPQTWASAGQGSNGDCGCAGGVGDPQLPPRCLCPVL